MFAARNMLFARAAAGGSAYEAEIDAWIAAIIAQGDTVSSNNAAAWNAVVAGAKSAGYWSEIKCLVPIAGPALGGNRAPVHIVGISPTISGTFASGERTTDDGFIANGTAYLDTGVAGNSTTYFGGQDDFYYGLYLTRPIGSPYTTQQFLCGGGTGGGGKFAQVISSTSIRAQANNATLDLNVSNVTTFTGIVSSRRTASNAASARAGSVTASTTATSVSPDTLNIRIFQRSGSLPLLSPAAIGAYAFGTSGVDESHFRGLLDTCFAALT